jgi:hypothetical protein
MILIPASVTKAATPCDAAVRATPREDQVTSETRIKVWGVNLDTKVECAKVYFDVIVTERLFDGEEITVTDRTWRKSSTLGETFKVDHTIAKDSTVTDWKIKVVRCVVCGTE